MQKLRIGGIKESLAQCKFDLEGPDLSQQSISKISQLLAFHKINIELLVYKQCRNGNNKLSICIDQEKSADVTKLLNNEIPLFRGCDTTIRKDIGIITIFPHRSVLMLLGSTIASLEEQSIPFYGIATSLSAISFIIDYRLVGKAINILQAALQLPENHAPMKPQVQFIPADKKGLS